ncbi:c-type cytochrome biogenesis protein CcsB [Pseudonocardia alaniniphila]|uniref:C-type cytochrome biogenesis protein CcsB n=1 Tax=Pseudonocardia alaniniphila TaxID=75291 RepID=A0ABS9TMM5_9PSEU|nr:c-type cytochrome biogenesis protein CcsB [Pseudonocardia alaniniphila]MCH6169658.1 c-type cytochrome biogenesis protein CcsB [Pseudonocardia alaniniphila]
MLSEFALYSDRLFMAAVSVYVLAMVLHGAEYAVQRSAKAVLVGAGGPALDTRSDGPRPDAPAGRSRAERFGRMGVSLVVLGAVLHAASIVLRGLAAQRWPLGNMYEFTSAICLAAIVAWLVMLRRSPAARPVGLFVLLPVVILLFLGGTVLYAPAAPVMPALQSYWLVVHVTTVSIASGLLMVPGVASLLFLLRRSGRLADFADRLPSADALDRLAYRITIVAFPLYTFAIMAGAIWAEAAWGRFWGWDPKETVAFVAWVIYAAYLHARATAGWRNGPAAWVNVAGFAAIVFNFFFINMVVSGLHSYAGLG